MKKSTKLAALSGAAFLMATSAIGPGFITQTTVYTRAAGASFGFVILISILIDVAVQLNIWRIITVSGMRAQQLAEKVIPGAGIFLAVLVAIGGLAFNIGNVAGAGLGLNVLCGIDVKTGAVISAAIGIFIFLYREAGNAMDWFSRVLGILMIGLTLYVAIHAHPPLAEAMLRTVRPVSIDPIAIITLVGGTVGGYISFAGAHRLLDAGMSGPANIAEVTRGSVSGILLASSMRILLFVAALGVVVQAAPIDAGNPAASVFQFAAGNIGYRIFGVVLWCAAITSVVGSAYTAISFLRSLHPFAEQHNRALLISFILVSTLIFLFVGKAVQVLVFVGTLNGFILPFAMSLMLIACRKTALMAGYKYPLALQIIGWLVVLAILVVGIASIS